VQERLEKSIALLEQFKNGTLPAGVSDGELWQALKAKQVGFTEKCCWNYKYIFFHKSNELKCCLISCS